MKLYTIDNIPGAEIEALGIVKGNVVRAKNIGRDMLAGLKNITGGEITAYTEMLSESRDIAIERMVEEAEKLGADAVVGLRFQASSVMEGTSEIISYGTAVRIK